MRIKFLTFFYCYLLCSVLLISYTPYKVLASSNCSAQGMCVIETNSGRVVSEYNKDKQLPMASTTKIVTAITVLDNLRDDLDTKYIVPSLAIGIEGTSMYLREGEELTKRELLYGLMLPSGNDAATALALLTANSEKEFCELMQETATKVGALNSSFANAHGLDASGHYTTADDLAKITAYALQNPTFMEISITKNIVIEATNKSEQRFLRNKNKLLHTLDECIGVKIGFTDNAGRCLVSAVEKNGLRFVGVVLNCGPMFEESAQLLKNAMNQYQLVNILHPHEYITSLPVKGGKKNFARIYSENGFVYPLTEDEINNLDVQYEMPDELVAPVDREKIIGNVKVFINNHLLFSTKICSIDVVEIIDKNDALDDIINKWF